MVTECPQKWVWGAPSEEQKRLAPLLAGLEKLCGAQVTVTTAATAFHKRSVLLLAQWWTFMFEMTPDVPWVRTRMLAEPISASDIVARVSKTTHSDLKNSRVVPMRPEKGYISLVRRCLCFYFSACSPLLFALFLIAARLQRMGIVRDSLPPVPVDKEVRAKNRARNEEQKKIKEDKKAKATRKAQRREISAKNHREAEKAGVPLPDSSETSVSEIEGGGDNVHWLDKLVAEEDDVIPLSAGDRDPGGVEGPRWVGGLRGVPSTGGRPDRPPHYCR